MNIQRRLCLSLMLAIAFQFFTTKIIAQPLPQYQLSIQNPVLIGTTYRFDIYLKRVGATNFRIGNSQFILTFNTSAFLAPALTRVGASEQIGTGFVFDQVIANGNELRISLIGNGSYSSAIDIGTAGPGTRISTFQISGVNVPIVSTQLTWVNLPTLIRTGVSEINALNNYRDITDGTGASHLNGGGEFGRISGYKFNDLNGNGVWNQPTEAALNGWTITLSGPNGPYTAITGSGTWATGYYEFDNLTPGSYSVTEVLQSGWSQTTMPLNPITVVAGQHLQNNLFGNYNGPGILGMKYEDIDGNGAKNGADSGLAGWKIFATKVGGGGSKSQLTNAAGNYFFTFSPSESGLWEISETTRTGWIQKFPVSPATYTVDVQSGTFETGKDFGNFHPSTISGTKFIDTNGDSIRQPAEPVVSNWRIILSRNGHHIDSVLTDGSGAYVFGGLPPGTYTVSESLKSGWTQTLPGGNGTYSVTISSGGTYVIGKDFGNFEYGSMTGIAYYDINHNGTMDVGENGMASLTIDAVGPHGIYHAITGAGGVWDIQNVFAGTYTVSEHIPPGYHLIEPSGGTYSVLITSGSSLTGLRFGNSAATDTFKFRTITYESYALDRHLHGRLSSGVPAKPDKIQYCFEVPLDTHMVNGLQINFSNFPFTNAPDYPFIVTPTPSSITFLENIKRVDIEWPTPFNHSERISICAWAMKSKSDKQVASYLLKLNGAAVGSKSFISPEVYTFLVYRWPMPNSDNVLGGTFTESGFGSPETGGVIAGVRRPDSSRYYGWVRCRTSVDVERSFVYRHQLHTDATRGFDQFSSTGSLFRGEQRRLWPWKQNNRLFADLVSLKLNITASALGILPEGIGELIYDDGANTLSTLSLQEIAEKADTALTYWRGNSQSLYVNLDTVIRKINQAFAGPMDTISFSSGLVIKGVKLLQDVPFLRANPLAHPLRIQPKAAVYSQVPDGYALCQNYPNPFNPTTTIEFDLKASSIVTLKIYNLLGQEVATLFEKVEMDEGNQLVEFDASSFASGVYFYRLTVQSMDEKRTTFYGTKKMLLLK
jgi:hypothetical protein